MRDWRSGSLRERRPGVWEFRIAVATDPLTGRSIQRSFSVRGTRAEVEVMCVALAGEYAERRVDLAAAPFVTVGEILARWIDGDHDWKPSTWSSYRSVVRSLDRDPLARGRVARLTPAGVRAAVTRWRDEGASPAVVAGRFRTLRAALGWAAQSQLIDRSPLEGVRGPVQPEPRLHAPVADVLKLLAHAEQRVQEALVDEDGGRRSARKLHAAEQMWLLVRVAADTGARRGELAALKIEDLDGRVLTVARAASMEEIGPTKTRQVRRITLGGTTAGLWHELVTTWQDRLADGLEVGEWLFSVDATHQRRLTTSHLAHSFARLRVEAGVPAVTLHRLRHGVATFLVDRGAILKAQQRLGHRDASTTLRNYAHALPLEDVEVADAIDALLSPNQLGDG